jgi:hypothetical protein
MARILGIHSFFGLAHGLVAHAARTMGATGGRHCWRGGEGWFVGWQLWLRRQLRTATGSAPGRPPVVRQEQRPAAARARRPGAAGAATGGAAGGGAVPRSAAAGNDTCTDLGLSCTAGEQCKCLALILIGTAMPASGAAQDNGACNDVGAHCDYAGTQCACGFSDTWNCNPAPRISRKTTPSVRLGRLQCVYGTEQCSCQGGDWNCFGGGGGGCPAQAPNDGDPCQNNGAFCDFGQGNQCVCAQNNWFCN